MSITSTNGKVIVEFNINSISGAPALGAYLLRFSLGYTMPAHNKDVYFHKTFVKVYVGEENLYLGTAFPENSKTFKPFADSYNKGSLLYEVLVSKNALEEIEKVRAGKEIGFRLEIIGESDDGVNKLHGSEIKQYRSSQNEWIAVLKAMSFKGGIVFDLPMSIDHSDKVKTALTAIEKANEHLYYGNYDDVVAKCRIALESIISGWGNISLVNEQLKKDKKAMPKEYRFFNAVNQIVHFSHLSHHPDESDEYVSFSRSEAVFALGATIAAVSSYTDLELSRTT